MSENVVDTYLHLLGQEGAVGLLFLYVALNRVRDLRPDMPIPNPLRTKAGRHI
jgi:hypothetical protein